MPFPSTTRRFHEALVKRFGGAGEGLLKFLLGEAGTVPQINITNAINAVEFTTITASR